MPHVQIESVRGPARRAILKGLMAFNNAAVGKSKYKSVTLTLRHGKEIVGGLAGSVWMGWLYVELLWIADKYRGKGYGRSLMAKAEAEARKHGAENVYLGTFGFQAPGFYKKLGYKEFGKLRGYAPGQTCFWMQKVL